MAWFLGIDVLFHIMFVSSLICHPSNHPKQRQHRRAWQAGRQAGLGAGVEECQESSCEALGEESQERAVLETVSPPSLPGQCG